MHYFCKVSVARTAGVDNHGADDPDILGMLQAAGVSLASPAVTG